ncbi:MAG: hypothetical protein ACE37B_15830 [Ilumatobacter sp.]|jgi:hypothetical protein|uniref:hypothetical protein n=1 Tax=Ilumatobacter sp. TaxID=1967498 RepID=UPI00391A89FD
MRSRAAAILAMIAAGVGFVGVADTVEAGEPTEASIDLIVEVSPFRVDPDSAAAGDALTLQLTDEGTPVAGCIPSGAGAERRLTCGENTASLQDGGTYSLEVLGISPGYYVSTVECLANETPIVTPDELPIDVTFQSGADVTCFVEIERGPVLYIDKVVSGGPLGSSDFPLEIYDADGALVETGAITDPSNDVCSFEPLIQLPPGLIDTDLCAGVRLAPGTYTLGEVLPDYGYEAVFVTCEIDSQGGREVLPSPAFDVTHGEIPFADTLCTLRNEYVTELVRADIEIVNDSGGSATGADFTIEVYDSAGTIVASGVDPAPGVGNASFEAVLPIGAYTFGVAGPEGYEASATVTPVVDDDQTEVIDDASAQFSLSRDLGVAGVIVVDDQVAPTTTTTTTTTTTVAPTTAAPTTAAPTTTIVMLLPETGQSDSMLPLMLVALLLIGFGGAAIASTRRT